jgi:hypothetical protein
LVKGGQAVKKDQPLVFLNDVNGKGKFKYNQRKALIIFGQ